MVAEAVKDGQGLFPGIAGSRGLTGRLASRGEMIEGEGLIVPVTYGAVQAEGLPVAGERLGVVA